MEATPDTKHGLYKIDHYSRWAFYLYADLPSLALGPRKLPIDDPATRNGKLRIDGRVVRDNYLFEVKKPSEARSDWDLYKLK
jgi:hypothetical protein